MFIQVIEGRTHDPEALRAWFETWQRELQPDAIGFLGSTGGITDDGGVIFVARFESREAAERNAARPEQDRWWRECEACFDGPVRFHDSEDVQVMEHGPRREARFVQVMEGRVADRDRAVDLEREAEPMLREMRPDLLGALTVYHGDGEYTEVAYFTSEQDARAAEQRPVPDDVADRMAEWGEVMHVDRYLDLRDPMVIEAS
jgi:hypothetical protein